MDIYPPSADNWPTASHTCRWGTSKTNSHPPSRSVGNYCEKGRLQFIEGSKKKYWPVSRAVVTDQGGVVTIDGWPGVCHQQGVGQVTVPWGHHRVIAVVMTLTTRVNLVLRVLAIVTHPSMLGAVPDSSYFLSFYWQNILVMCSSETTGNLFRHIMVSDFCKKIANFCLTSPQHGRNVKLKKLHCKSPRFHAYFRKKSIFSSNKAFFGYGP